MPNHIPQLYSLVKRYPKGRAKNACQFYYGLVFNILMKGKKYVYKVKGI
jgi:hypothetical protein